MKDISSIARRVGLALMACAVLVLPACFDSGGGGGSSDSKIDFGENDRNVVVAMGDSITEGGFAGQGAPYPDRLAQLSGKTVINQGSSGEESSGGAGRVGSVLSRYKPGYLLILYGANDVIVGRPPDSTDANLRSMVRAAKGNKTIPVIGTMLPVYDSYEPFSSGMMRMSDRIRTLAKEEGARLVDLQKEFGNNRGFILDDGLHPSDAGLQLMALAFNDRI